MVSSKRGSVFKRTVRFFSAVAVCLFILILAGVAIVYFALHGRSDRGSTLLTQIETQIEQALGPRFDVVIKAGDTDLSSIGRVSFVAHGLAVNDVQSNQTIGVIENLTLDADWFSFLIGGGGFDEVKISEFSFDTSKVLKQNSVGLPPDLKQSANNLGKFLSQISSSFQRNGFNSIQLVDGEISGPLLGRKNDEPVKISNLEIQKSGNDKISLEAKASSAFSSISAQSSYSTSDGFGSSYNFEIAGVSLREWSVDPAGDAGFVALNGIVGVSGSLVFDGEGNAQDPTLKLVTGEGLLRLGKNERVEISSLDLNLKVFLDKNQIELERSFVSAGGFEGTLIGGLKPTDMSLGYNGSVLYDIIIERGEYTGEGSDDAPVPGGFQASGVFDPKNKFIDVSKVIFTTAEGGVTGSAKIGLDGETPSLQGRLITDGIQVRALKQFWPFFVASAARKWVLGHIHDGWVEKGEVFADIPPGILFKLREGRKLSPEHYKSTLEVRDFSFRPFGDMPRIEKAKGEVVLEGMKIEAHLTSGIAQDGNDKSVDISKASFVMADFADTDRTGEASLELDGDIQAIARISDRKPLRVLERMKVSPEQFSGKGHANVAAVFPVGRKISYDEVDWNVLLELENGASTKSLEGRRIGNANLLIDANSSGAKVSGTANIDGVKSAVEIVQPIGKSGAVKPSRKISATLSEKDRKELGFDLNPVIKGPISVVIERANGRESHSIDFKNSEISLPWVGWSKGKGIDAKGRFDLEQSKGNYVLKNFSLAGAGFEATGNLVLSKKGLLSANLSKVALNAGDDIRLKVVREKDTYNINASGLSFDGRSILNTLIHSGSFSKVQGGRSVNLVANFETIRGFNRRIMRNAILLYESRNGQLTRLDMTAAGSDGRKYSVQAQLNGNDTLFTMATNDAGNALAFTDIYTKMEGGVLDANLIQSQNGPFYGPVTVKGFDVVNEPRLARLATGVKSQVPTERGENVRILPDAGDKKVKFQIASAQIERGSGYLSMRDAVIRSGTMGFTANGDVYDQKDRMNLSGTFMPANGVNLAVSAIPILGSLLSNGRDNALIGITYKLSGQRKNPKLEVNPLSIVAPGVFNRVFEFK